MKNIRHYTNRTNDYNQCIFQYKMAVRNLKEFMQSDAYLFVKGFLYRKIDRRSKDNRVYLYFIRVDYINGKRKELYKRVKTTENLEFIQKMLAQKRCNRKKYTELLRSMKLLKGKVLKYMKKEGFDNNIFKTIENNWLDHEEFKKKHDRHESTEIITALGENVRSRGECIIANLAFAQKIPYLYEPALRLHGFDDIDDIFDEIVRPDFEFFIKGKSVLLEFLGMVDSEDYMRNWERRLRHYNNCNITHGKNLISIACRDKRNIDSQKITQTLIDMVRGIIPNQTVYV